MKLTICCWIISLVLLSTDFVSAQPSISIANTSKQEFSSTVVAIPWATVLKAYPSIDTARLRIVQIPAGAEVPYQLEHRGEKTVQNLLIQVSVAPKQRIQLNLLAKKPAPVPSKTYCRYVPERFDDFAWENDKIAFRIYGKALNGRKDNAYGTDVWSKRTDQLVLDKWYKRDNYHKDAGEGLDYYHVGFTLGAGDVGVWLGDSINFVHNYTTWEVLDNGPLRSTFRVGYPTYTVGGTTIQTTKIISLDAGSQLSRVEVRMTHNHPPTLPLVVGITLRPEPGRVDMDKRTGIISYWEPAHGDDGTLGIGCVISGKVDWMRQQHKHALAGVAIRSGAPLVYYDGAAWDKAGQITSSAAWRSYLQQFATRLRQPLSVSGKK